MNFVTYLKAKNKLMAICKKIRKVASKPPKKGRTSKEESSKRKKNQIDAEEHIVSTCNTSMIK